MPHEGQYHLKVVCPRMMAWPLGFRVSGLSGTESPIELSREVPERDINMRRDYVVVPPKWRASTHVGAHPLERRVRPALKGCCAVKFLA